MAKPLSSDMADAVAQIVAIMSRDDAALASRQTLGSASISDLVYRGLRYWGLAQVRLARLAKHPPELNIQALMAISWAAIHEQMRETHVIVDQAVEAAKRVAGEKAVGFVNALLRNTIRDREASHDFEKPIARWNAPLWWIEKIQRDWGSKAPAILDALRVRPPLTVRLAAGLENAAEQYLEQLRGCGLSGRIIGPAAVAIDPPVSVDRIPGFSQGQVSVQDASAQRAAALFEDAVGLSNREDFFDLLDACAAPGGKTIALAQRYLARVWALDQSATRLARLSADLPRVNATLKGEVRPVVADVLNPQAWPSQMPSQFDAILLDAPCSASGVCRRHPEIPWKRSPQDIDAVADIQRKMLDVLWARLKPGGELAFVTCSVFKQEGEEQAQSFLDRTPDAKVQPSPGRLFPIADPDRSQNQDGFFFAKFQKAIGAPGAALARSNSSPRS